MQFTDKQFNHRSAIASSLRKPISHEADEVAKLAEEICDETFGLKFQDTLASSVHDLAASAVAKEVDKVERDVRQGGKVGANVVRELVRAVNKVSFTFFYS